MGDYQPVNSLGKMPMRKTASATVTGGTLVDATGDNTVGPAAGALRPIGVAAKDAVNGEPVAVWSITGVEHEISPTGVVAIAAGNPIKGAAAGLIDTGVLATLAGAGTLIGTCTRGGTGGTSKARFIGG